MKTYLPLLLCSFVLLFSACGSDPNPTPEPEPTPVIPQITLGGSESFTLTDAQESSILSFTSNVAWTVSVADTRAGVFDPSTRAMVSENSLSSEVFQMKSYVEPVSTQADPLSPGPRKVSVSTRIESLPASVATTQAPATTRSTRASTWLSVSPASGPAGNATVTVSALKNDTGEDREGFITIQAGELTKTLSVTQKKEGALILTESKKHLPKEGGTIDVELQTNLEYTIEIPSGFRSWISQAQSKSIASYTLRFDITPSIVASTRRGWIIVKAADSSLADTLVVTQAGIAEGVAKDRAALIALYQAMGGDNWTDKTNWCSDKPLSQWYGVWYNQEGGGRVTGLLLDDNNLSGTIPMEIGDLDELRQFWVNRNPKLGGNFPEEIFGLEHLRELLCSSCAFTGRLSDDIGKLVNLKQLWLGNNRLTGKIPASIGSLTLLQELHLHNAGYVNGESASNYNTFSGELPAELGTMTELVSLSLYGNQFSGSIPEVLGEMTGLQILDLSTNKLTGQIPASLGGLSNLNTLNLNDNQLTGEIPDEIGSLTSLVSLDLSRNRLSGAIPSTMGGISGLDYLAMGGNALSGSIPSEIGGLRSLRMLDLFNNRLSGSIPDELCNAISLTWIRLNNFEEGDYTSNRNTLSGPIPTRIGDLAKLEVLMLSNNNLTGGIPESVSNVSNLSYLFLYGNRLSGDIPTPVTKSRFWQRVEPQTYVLPQQSGYVLNVLDDKQEDQSSDYSQDGTVLRLQQATRGSGIDLVFMGDGYNDRSIASGDYDEVMRKVVAHFFTEEPAKSFQEYFNVYSVRVVSPYSDIGYGESTLKTHFGEGTLVIGDNDKCFEYARKVSGIDLTKALVTVILNTEMYAGTCYLYSDNAAIAYFPLGTDDAMFGQLINHEAVGHGFGKLLDEYDYPGTITPAALANFQAESAMGWGQNVDVTADPSQVKWASFISDARYPEVSVYEGAYTYRYGAYRPTYNSIMRDNTGGFNAPSRNAIYKRVMDISGTGYSYDNFIAYDAINRTPAAAATRSAQSSRVDPKTFVPLHPPVVVKGSHK